ncbi:MAG: glycosyltransferase family 4 protein [Verrucomicrobia bacterium]|nr:glycosyltransferase family 4 protein [Verrucomicrobiota bacterium]
MKILLIAFSCNPDGGSEGGVGWKAANLISQSHEVWVITHVGNREALLKAQELGKVPESTKYVFHGKKFQWHPNRMLARLQSWKIYYDWLRALPSFMAISMGEMSFDLIHHVTIATWRIPPILRGQSAPLVWGPIGGAANYPWRLLGVTSFYGGLFEIFRNIMNTLTRDRPQFKRGVRATAAVICANNETARTITCARGTEKNVYKLTAASFSKQERDEFLGLLKTKIYEGELRAFAGGICIGSKGLLLALLALKKAKEAGHTIHYTIASTGPELQFLKRKARSLGLMGQVEFHAGFRGNAYKEVLGGSQIYLLPSFREGSPSTILEAMLAGAVPVVMKASTPGEIVTPECGFAVPVRGAGQIVEDLAKAMVRLAEDRALLKQLSLAAHKRVADEFAQEKYVERINRIYLEVTDPNQAGHG